MKDIIRIDSIIYEIYWKESKQYIRKLKVIDIFIQKMDKSYMTFIKTDNNRIHSMNLIGKTIFTKVDEAEKMIRR